MISWSKGLLSNFHSQGIREAVTHLRKGRFIRLSDLRPSICVWFWSRKSDATAHLWKRSQRSRLLMWTIKGTFTPGIFKLPVICISESVQGSLRVPLEWWLLSWINSHGLYCTSRQLKFLSEQNADGHFRIDNICGDITRLLSKAFDDIGSYSKIVSNPA